MRRPMLRLLAACLLSTAPLAACASAGGSGVSRSPNLITAEELAGLQELHAMGAIQRLRPNWLRPRGTPTPAAMAGGEGLVPALRVDGVPRSSLDELTGIALTEVQEIRFLSASDATTMYGTGFPNGLIEVRTRSR